MCDQEDLFGDLPVVVEALPPAQQDSRAKALRSKRNRYLTHLAPSKPMSSLVRGWTPPATPTGPSEDVRRFVDWFDAQQDARERFRWALRDSLDELLDGQRTGRWCYQHLSKTEKTYLGTAVEVNLTKEFGIDNGDELDWRIAGADLDCKFSKDLGGWEIPMEMYLCADHEGRSGRADHAALLVWLSDDTSQWAAGLLTVTDERLRWRQSKGGVVPSRAYNRDNKRRLAVEAAGDVHWLWGGVQDDLPSNLILHLPEDARLRIFADPSGQKRADQLFREVRDRLVSRQVVLTVAQQDDSPKRVRDARDKLKPEGIVILGHQKSHSALAEALGLPRPIKGEWVATRLTTIVDDDPRPSVTLEGRRWGRARDGEAVVAAPALPKSYSSDDADD